MLHCRHNRHLQSNYLCFWIYVPAACWPTTRTGWSDFAQHRDFRIFSLKPCAMIASQDLTRKEKLEKLEAETAEPSSQKDSMMLVEVKDNLVLAFRHGKHRIRIQNIKSARHLWAIHAHSDSGLRPSKIDTRRWIDESSGAASDSRSETVTHWSRVTWKLHVPSIDEACQPLQRARAANEALRISLARSAKVRAWHTSSNRGMNQDHASYLLLTSSYCIAF